MKKSSAVFILHFIVLSFIWASNSGANPGIIPVAKFTSPALPGGVPEGWSLEKKAGIPSMKIEKEDNIFYLHLISLGDSSFGLRKEASVDVKKFPILRWRWKVKKLPRGGDVRKSSTDDQALQVYVAFKETGFPSILNTPVIGYIWDNEAPKGWTGRSQQIGGNKLRYIVLRNKTDKIGQWYAEQRNIYQDYKRLFRDIKGGEPQGLTTGLQIYINSQRTKSPAEGLVGEIYFSDEPSDIALVEAEKAVKISAIKRPVTAKFSTQRKEKPRLDCINISIDFKTDSITVEENYADEMQTVASYLIRNPEIKLTIIGHTDNVGTEEYNLALSNRRAERVKHYLVNKFNFDSQRLLVQGAGSSQPITDNDTLEGRQHNRRVSIKDCPE
jgi:outer membrane protein OmpA-like peptidoglycan-associated protein